MALSDYALITVAELRPSLQGGFMKDSRIDADLEDLINDVSDTIERDLDRLLVSRGNITSYFTAPPQTADLFTYQWPLLSVTSVHEDLTRQYGASALLTANSDYVVSAPPDTFSYVSRTWSSTQGLRSWLTGWRTIKMVYSAGYATRAAVPYAIKRVAKRLAVTTWGEWRRGVADLSQESSSLGTFTRFSAAFLTTDMRRELMPFRRPQWWHDYEARVA